MKKRDIETMPFSARISRECRQQMEWVSTRFGCTMREVMERAVNDYYQKNHAYTTVMMIGAQEMVREQAREEQCV